MYSTTLCSAQEVKWAARSNQLLGSRQKLLSGGSKPSNGMASPGPLVPCSSAWTGAWAWGACIRLPPGALPAQFNHRGSAALYLAMRADHMLFHQLVEGTTQGDRRLRGIPIGDPG